MTKLAFILPREPDLGWIRRARAVLSALPEAAEQHGYYKLELVLGIHEGPGSPLVMAAIAASADFKAVARPYRWQAVESARASRMYPRLSFDYTGIDTVFVPHDWGWNFCDCDAWITPPDLQLGAVLPLRPIMFFARSLEERYDPAIARMAQAEAGTTRQLESMLGWRQATCVFASHPRTLTDFGSYAGVWANRHVLTAQIPPIGLAIDGAAKASSFVVFVLVVPPDHRGNLAEVCRGFRGALASFPQVRLRFALDCSFREETFRERASLSEYLERLDLLMPASYEVTSFQTESDLNHSLRDAHGLISLCQTPGDPEELTWAAAAGIWYVGLRTPQALSWSKQFHKKTILIAETSAAALRSAVIEAVSGPIEDCSRPPLPAYTGQRSGLDQLFQRLRETTDTVVTG